MTLRFLRTHGYATVLTGIVLVGAYLRLRYFPQWIWEMPGYDESRDMLVARHITEYGDHVWRGPLAAGSNNIMMNSPVYYYLIAALWFLGRSPYGVMVLWACVMTMPIYIGYRIGREVWDSMAGIYIALLIAVHPEFVMLSKQLGQPQLIPVWLLTVLWLYIRKNHLTFMSFSLIMAFVFLSLHIHYGSLLVFPVVFVWSVFLWIHGRKHGKIPALVHAVITAEWLALIWAYLTFRSVPFDQLSFTAAYQQHAVDSFWQTVLHALREVMSLAFPGLAYDWAYVLFGMCAGVLAWCVQFGNFPARSRIWYLGLLACLSFSFAFVGLYNGHISPTYLFSILTVIVVMQGLAIRWVGQWSRIGAMACAVCISFFLFRISIERTAAPAVSSQFEQHKSVADAIYTDYVGMRVSDDSVENGDGGSFSVPSFVLATLSAAPYLVYDGWGTGSSWYWLEQYFSRRLVSLTDSVTNFSPLVQRPRYFYVICDHRDNPDAAPVCMRRFVGARAYLSASYTTVFATKSYTVWRYAISPDYQGTAYNVAYGELLHPAE